RSLERTEYDDVVHMLARGYLTKRGRRAALLTHDPVNEKLRARHSSRMTAIMCGGAIPEVFDYRVLLEPEGTFIGTLNEDFAVESLPGDVFSSATRRGGSCASATAWCASRMRKASRPRCRSGSAKRRRAPTR